MPFNGFAAKQRLEFQIVASRYETSWKEPTLCCRLLLEEGVDIELQATQAALQQWQQLTKEVVYTMEISRTCLKKYSGSDKTGIKNNFLIHMKYKNNTLQRCIKAFETHVYQNHTVVNGAQLQQISEDELINVIGIVENGGVPPAAAIGNTLPRRELSLLDNDWSLKIDLIGELAQTELARGTKVIVISVKKRAYCGITNLESTRLSFILINPPWATFTEKDAGSPVKKALKSETLTVLSVDAAKRSSGDNAVRVKAIMVPIEAEIFDMTLWTAGAGGESMRLPVTLRDTTADLHVTLWNSQFSFVIPYNVDELSVMWEACNEGEDAKKTFLDTLNSNASKEYSWTLRPNKWIRNDGESVMQ